MITKEAVQKALRIKKEQNEGVEEGLLVGKCEDADEEVKNLWEFVVLELCPAVSPKSQFKEIVTSARHGSFDGDPSSVMENISASDEAMVLTVLDVKWEEILEEREREKRQKNKEGNAESDMSTDSTSSSQESGQASNPGGKKKSG